MSWSTTADSSPNNPAESRNRPDRDSEPAAPRDAASVILLRPGADGGFEVFLMRRHRHQAFMGGVFVFPGGAFDAVDADPETQNLCRGMSPAAARRLLQEETLPETLALGFYVTGLRETFEEAAVLFATASSGDELPRQDPAAQRRYEDYRRQVHAGNLSFSQLAGIESLRYRPDRLAPYARWITPEAEPRRFDTRFFIAVLPEGQAASHDAEELVASQWLQPAEALLRHEAGALEMMPPTLKILEELTAYLSLESLFAATTAKPILPILPQVRKSQEVFQVLLPHDPEYTLAGRPDLALWGGTSRYLIQPGSRPMVRPAPGGTPPRPPEPNA
jgi:8-oxo-dGTP pyrophosphatase MutT (NUDIX family)